MPEAARSVARRARLAFGLRSGVVRSKRIGGRLERAGILGACVAAACVVASCGGGEPEITLQTTCREYLTFDDQSRGIAIRTLAPELGWSGAGSPFARLNFDAHCAQRLDQTMETALTLFAS